MQLLVTVTRISRRHSGRSHSTGALIHMEEKKKNRELGGCQRREFSSDLSTEARPRSTAATDNSSALQNMTITATEAVACSWRDEKVYSRLPASPHESIAELLLGELQPQGHIINIPLGHLKKPLFWMSRSSSVQSSTF